MNIKQKVRRKIRQMSIDIFSNFVGFNRLFFLVYTNENDDGKRFRARWY